MESCGSTHESVEQGSPINEFLLRELAKECGVALEDQTSMVAIEEKLELKYYNPKTGKCLIPVDKNLNIINSSLHH